MHAVLSEERKKAIAHQNQIVKNHIFTSNQSRSNSLVAKCVSVLIFTLSLCAIHNLQ